jgi:glutathione S-transferase
VGCLPHSEEACRHHPLGFIPVLAHQRCSGEEPFEVYESAAIARYLDAVIFPAARVPSAPSLRSTDDDPRTNARIDTIASLAADHLFRRLEFGVVKPRLALEQQQQQQSATNGDDHEALEAEIRAQVQPGLAALEPVLALLEALLGGSGGGEGYFVGHEVTWADLFVYPPLADLRATPEGAAVLPRYPRLAAWAARMEQREEARRTYDGTVASQRPPKQSPAKY